ncbi:hypothetical protein AXW84_00840 [Hymenobacter sp. PAMC 26628]|nr:hypothetical protein AXW84_00840 [Hymenobacter sp. PAMC 26628]
MLFTLSLLVSCRSEQVAFQFTTPVGQGPGDLARTPRPAPPVATETPAAVPAAAVTATPAAVAAVGAPARKSFGRSVRSQAQHLLALSPLAHPVAAPEAPAQLRPHRRAAGALARTQHTAEAGLGRTVLFILGVVLAVLAGLAALVNLIFGVGFFTALGYTAAGLVVLYLLYTLFSPKKPAKKKA